MLAWEVHEPGPIATGPLRATHREVPEPAEGEVLIRVRACGVCRTDLHVTEGDLPVHLPGVTPGHEIVGEVVAYGDSRPPTRTPPPTDPTITAPGSAAPSPEAAATPSGSAATAPGSAVTPSGSAVTPSGVTATAREGAVRGVGVGPGRRRFAIGERVGVAWLRGTCGVCAYCRRGAENLCPSSVYTGWDAHGGYAEYAVAPEAYLYALPGDRPDVEVAPLLCAGIIGYRALRRAEPPPGGRLGIWGFGGSAHLAAQIAIAEGTAVHVFTRSPAARRLALELGVESASDSFDASPEPLDSAIVFAPAGELVPAALRLLDRGGTLAVAGIHLSDIPALNYQEHLFQERTLRSVTSNTRADGEEFLRLADRLGLRVTTTPYALDQADRALADLAADRVSGAGVLLPAEG